VTAAAGRGRRIKVVLFSFVVWTFIGTSYFTLTEHEAQGWDFANTLYFSFVTLTTIGLGDLFPESPAGRAGLIAFALMGLGLLATVLDLIGDFFEDVRVRRQARLKVQREEALKKKAEQKHA